MKNEARKTRGAQLEQPTANTHSSGKGSVPLNKSQSGLALGTDPSLQDIANVFRQVTRSTPGYPDETITEKEEKDNVLSG